MKKLKPLSRVMDTESITCDRGLGKERSWGGQFLKVERSYYSTKEKGSRETNWGHINKEVWNNTGEK